MIKLFDMAKHKVTEWLSQRRRNELGLTVSISLTRIIFWIVPIATGIALFLCTPWGLGLSPDSVAYVNGAKRFLAGGNLNALSSHWPPLYPLLLAAFGSLTNASPLLGARIFHALLIGLNLLLFSEVFRRIGLKPLVALVLGFLVAIHPVILGIHIYAWTEPAFLSLLIVNLLLLDRFLVGLPVTYSQKLALSLAVVAGLASLLRYAGLAIVLCNMLAIALYTSSSETSKRIRLVAEQACVSILILLPWLLFNLSRSSSMANRTLAYHPPRLDLLEHGLSTIGRWFWDESLVAILLSFCVWIVIRNIRFSSNKDTKFSTVAALFALVYICFLIAAISFTDAATSLDDRMLSPVFVVLVVVISDSATLLNRPAGSAFVITMLAFMLALPLHLSLDLLQLSRTNGLEFASRQWQETPIVQRLRTMSSEFRVATNAPELFSLYLPQKANMLPYRFETSSRKSNPLYAEEVSSIATTQNLIAMIGKGNFRPYLTSRDEIERLGEFRKIYTGDDGIIWENKLDLLNPLE